MHEEFFARRLAELRLQKNVSAREMSLDLGQNDSYINRIENGVAFPSMQSFFYICEYLQITPSDFFALEIKEPGRITRIMELLHTLDAEQLDTVYAVAKGLSRAK